MKTLLNRSVTALAAVTAFGLGVSPVMAEEIYPQFKVDQGSNGIQLGANQDRYVVASKIVGGYREVITFGAGTFEASLVYQASQFVDIGGTNDATNIANYGLYGIYTASGNFSTAGGKTTFTFVPGAADSFNLFLDLGTKTTFAEPATGADAFIKAGYETDKLLATGKPITGAGSIECFTTNLCGSFGATTSFDLTDAGKLFFIEPTPFYGLSIQTGQLNSFTPSGRVSINGSIDTIFAVPEPTPIALLGLGFLGLALSRRRAKKA
jgi:hypothetical protein